LETIFIGSLEISGRESSKVQNCLKKLKIEKLGIGKLYAWKLKIWFEVFFESQKTTKKSKF
jgi:hypothetical protein